MAPDKIILLNHQIVTPPIEECQYTQYNFIDYLKIHTFFLKQKNQHTQLDLYDITYNPNYPNNTIFLINDHINKIGNNPFIGNQKFFNIDFINIANLYLQNKQGIITTCYGERYEQNKTRTEFPSTHIANVAALAHTHQYTITGYLINQI